MKHKLINNDELNKIVSAILDEHLKDLSYAMVCEILTRINNIVAKPFGGDNI